MPVPDTTLPTSPAAPLPAPGPAPQPPVATTAATEPPAEPKAPAPEPAKPFSWKDDFDALAHGGKALSANGLKKSGLSLKEADANKDGKVDYGEFRSAKVKANSFEGLDADGNGKLDAQELAKLRRFDDRAYGDGQAVTKEEFVKTRRAELRDNRKAQLEARFEKGLSKPEAKLMKRFAGSDGKLTADEYVAGKHTLWREWHADRREKLFAGAGAKGGTLDVTTEKGRVYAGYDADGDGKVTKAEFETGYKADLQTAWEARTSSGQLADARVRDRLDYGKDTFAKRLPAPKADAGDLFANREKWFVSQYRTKYNTHEDVPGWDNANCGPTSLTMVAKAFGKVKGGPGAMDAAIEKSRKLMGDGLDERRGTSGEGIARGAKAYGLDAKIVNNIDLKAIEGELDKGRLPIINGTTIRADGSLGGGHFYVVTKIKDGKAYLNDPYWKEGPRVVSTDTLMRSVNAHWSKRLVSVGPEKG